MDIVEKIELNKKIRKYEGSDGFISSLKRELKYKWCKSDIYNGKTVKILSDKQYEVAKSIL